MIRCARLASVRRLGPKTHDERQTNTRDAGIAAVDQPAGVLSLLRRLPAETLVLVHRSQLLLRRLDERPFVHQLSLSGQSLPARHRGEAPGFERQQSGALAQKPLAIQAVTLPIVAVLLNDREPPRR